MTQETESPDLPGGVNLVGKLVFHRIAAQRELNGTDDTFNISIQTRNTPQVYDRTGSELDIRIRPNTHERLPSVPGLVDLADVIRFIPDAVTRSSAKRVQVRGGAHLTVAFALGAAIPSSRVGNLEVVDQRGDSWTSGTEADLSDPALLEVTGSGSNPQLSSTGRSKVAIYLDLLQRRSDAAYERYLDEQGDTLTAWRHLRLGTDDLINPDDAGAVAAEAAHHIRELSETNNNAEAHLLLRCPFPIAVLVGRLCNTLRVTTYEWDDTDPAKGDADYRARYVATMKIRPSAATGAIEQVLPTH